MLYVYAFAIHITELEIYGTVTQMNETFVKNPTAITWNVSTLENQKCMFSEYITMLTFRATSVISKDCFYLKLVTKICTYQYDEKTQVSRCNLDL